MVLLRCGLERGKEASQLAGKCYEIRRGNAIKVRLHGGDGQVVRRLESLIMEIGDPLPLIDRDLMIFEQSSGDGHGGLNRLTQDFESLDRLSAFRDW